MIIITASAKTFDWDQPAQEVNTTKPEYLTKASQIAKLLGSYTKDQLKHQLNVSDTLAKLNFERFQAWHDNPTDDYAKPSLYAYKGDIFRELKLSTYTPAMIKYLQNSLRIISGLYGIVRPLDRIQQYRLEMKTNLSETNISKLSSYWCQDVTASLNKTLRKHKQKIILNLASKEYALAVNSKGINGKMVEIIFNQIKNGQSKNYGLMAKKARGKMIHFLTQNQADSLEIVKEFSADGYGLIEDKKNTLIFAKHI